MKTKILISLLALLSLLSSLAAAAPLGAAFGYQGRLAEGGNPANGSYDLQFALYDAVTNGSQLGPTLTNPAVTVSNGLFTVLLDFGTGIFRGDARWLEIAVRTNGSASDFTSLSPRQELAPTPYALYAPAAGTANSASNLIGVLAASQLSGTYSNALQLNNPGNSFAGSFAGDGSGLTNLNADSLASGTVPDARLSPNVALLKSSPTFTGTITAGGDLVGARLNAGTANFLTAGGSSIAGGIGSLIQSPNCNISGGATNIILTNAPFCVIGGGDHNTVGPSSMDSTIGGGNGNIIVSSWYSTISGGAANLISYSTMNCALGGGIFNTNFDNVFYATIAGGRLNLVYSTDGATIGGGLGNVIQTNAEHATISGGQYNAVGAGAQCAMVPGGLSNSASASYSFAAGRQAKAKHQGAFVWADSHAADFASTSTNQFLIRASGGVGIGTNSPTAPLDVAGDARVRGLIRSGSETGTSEAPNPAGLVVRRVNSTNPGANQVVAVVRKGDNTANITLERDGTYGGFLIRYPAYPGYMTIAAMGMDNTGTQRNFYSALANPSTAGTVQVYNNSQSVVHFECTFGDTMDMGRHLTQVTLSRYASSSLTDSYWSGTLMSTYNQ